MDVWGCFEEGGGGGTPKLQPAGVETSGKRFEGISLQCAILTPHLRTTDIDTDIDTDIGTDTDTDTNTDTDTDTEPRRKWTRTQIQTRTQTQTQT